MRLLDFIRNRKVSQQPSQEREQKPETAKQMYAREAAQDKANAKAPDQIPHELKQELAAIKSKLDRATQHRGQETAASRPVPSGSSGNPEPMRQNMVAQDKAAPPQSPTSDAKGKTAMEDPGSPVPSLSPVKEHDMARGNTQATPGQQGNHRGRGRSQERGR